MTRTVFALSAIALSTLAVSAAPAFAEVSKEVRIPVELKTDAQVKAYTDALIDAADRVCWRAASPMLGGAYDAYRTCKKATVRDTAAKDPTGLLAARLGQTPSMTVAAK